MGDEKPRCLEATFDEVRKSKEELGQKEKELEEGLGKTIPVEDVARLAVERGVSKTEVDEIIEKLKKAGDVYEPRYGFLSRM